jgi:hypothetical protein
MEVDCSGGNESGSIQTGATNYQWRLIDGTYYLRRMPSGAWKVQATASFFVIPNPLFAITEMRQLQYVGPSQKNGLVTDELQTTQWWAPEIIKLSGIDVTGLSISPQHTQLQLWVMANGMPVYATFRAWTDATDGTNLLDIRTTYAFSNGGYVSAIATPGK